MEVFPVLIFDVQVSFIVYWKIIMFDFLWKWTGKKNNRRTIPSLIKKKMERDKKDKEYEEFELNHIHNIECESG